jgi:ribosomal protein S18 acetylase RimI-like enzyme
MPQHAAMKIDEVIIRAARPDDVGRVLALWRDTRNWVGTTDDPSSLVALLEHESGALQVAEHDGHLLGSLIVVWDGWRGNMYRLTVHPDWQRQGIARRLVLAGERRLRAFGARRVTALVWQDNSRAVRVWSGAGYEHDQRTGRFVKTLA